MNQTPWRSEKLSARSLRIVFKIERKKRCRHERLRDFIVLIVNMCKPNRSSGKTTTGDIPGYPGITRPGVYPGITRDNPKQKTCNGISQDRNLVLGYPGISWDISRGDNLVQDGIWLDHDIRVPAQVRRITWDRPGYPRKTSFERDIWNPDPMDK